MAQKWNDNPPPSSKQLPVSEESRYVDYEYIVEVKGLEALAQMMKKDKIPVPKDFTLVTFRSTKLVDMKSYKESGAVSSYVIIKSEKRERLVEDSSD